MLGPFRTAAVTARQDGDERVRRGRRGGAVRAARAPRLASSAATKTQPRQRVQLPTGNGIPLFPGTMIRYVAV